MANNKTRAAVIIGAGDATGGAIAQAFAREGLTACVTRRPRHLEQLQALADGIIAAGGDARAYGVDARDEAATVALFDTVEAEVGPIEVCVFNIGANVRFPVTETTSRVYQKVWEMATFAGFLAGREAAKRMGPRGHGTIIFTGATAATRGAAGFSAFAGAKHGLRAFAGSLAREMGPQGIHVAHVIIDGAIDSHFIRENVPDFNALKEKDGVLNPTEIAKNYVWLHQQHRSAWTHELDLRPWCERW